MLFFIRSIFFNLLCNFSKTSNEVKSSFGVIKEAILSLLKKRLEGGGILSGDCGVLYGERLLGEKVFRGEWDGGVIVDGRFLRKSLISRIVDTYFSRHSFFILMSSFKSCKLWTVFT